MPLKSKLKVERLGVLLVSIFYVIVGGTEAIILALSNFSLIHVAPLAALSLIAAYGLFRMKRWAVFLVAILFFPALVFGAPILYVSVMWETFYPSVDVLLFHLGLIAYLILTLIASIYVMAVRKDFK
ncbi:hypothetical protein DRO69_00565 [Candidatus Bathyarchaeota archaeon]|nr:MAG: hypothetical protein DRO69_00565 [Candidatus Bathyarchaeota archaeon]